MIILTEFSGGVSFSVRLAPKASRNQIVGEYNSALKVQLTAPPIQGAANQALVNYLAKCLGVKKSQVDLLSGFKSKDKKIAIAGISKTELTTKIEQLLKEGKCE